MAYTRAKVLRNATVTIESVNYSGQVNKARLVPDTAIQTMKTFGGVDQDRDVTVWTLELSGHQDRGTGSLGDAMDDAIVAGGTLTLEIVAAPGTGNDKAVVEIVPVPIEFGGEQGNWKSFEQTFACVDQPVFSQSS